MKLSKSKYQIEGNQVYWFLYAHRVDLTIAELKDMIKNIKQGGLFSYLEQERPSLKSYLLDIINSSIETEYWESLDLTIPREQYIESFLEQCLLEIFYKLRS